MWSLFGLTTLQSLQSEVRDGREWEKVLEVSRTHEDGGCEGVGGAAIEEAADSAGR